MKDITKYVNRVVVVCSVILLPIFTDHFFEMPLPDMDAGLINVVKVFFLIAYFLLLGCGLIAVYLGFTKKMKLWNVLLIWALFFFFFLSLVAFYMPATRYE